MPLRFSLKLWLSLLLLSVGLQTYLLNKGRLGKYSI